MSKLLHQDGGTLHDKTFELIWQPKQPKPEDLEAFVEVLFDGRLIREAIQLRQESLEEMRPLATKFDSVVDLIAHLMYLDFVTAWPLARAEDQEQAQRLRVGYHRYSVDMATYSLENRLPPRVAAAVARAGYPLWQAGAPDRDLRDPGSRSTSSAH